MSISRTDHVRFAAAIASSGFPTTQRVQMAQLIADVLEFDNERFRRAEFLLACGLTETSMRERAKPKPVAKAIAKPVSRHAQRGRPS